MVRKNNHPRTWNFPKNRTKILFHVPKMLRPNAPHKTNRLGSNIVFYKLRLCICQTSNHHGTISLFTRSFLCNHRKDIRKQSRRFSRWLSVFPTWALRLLLTLRIHTTFWICREHLSSVVNKLTFLSSPFNYKNKAKVRSKTFFRKEISNTWTTNRTHLSL